MIKKTPLWALDNVRFDSDAGGDLTCREYLCALLDALWSQGEGFSGKRPFGNSGWEHDLMAAVASADCDIGRGESVENFVFEMIDAMANGEKV